MQGGVPVAAIVVRSLGPVRGAWRDAAQIYLQRLRTRLPFTWEEFEEISVRPDADRAQELSTMEREAERLLRSVPPNARLVALDPRGRAMDSEGFSRMLAEWQAASRPTYLLVGGHLGLSPALREKCELLSLSQLTFSHQMVPAILFEQIYRGLSILDGSPYHR